MKPRTRTGDARRRRSTPKDSRRSSGAPGTSRRSKGAPGTSQRPSAAPGASRRSGTSAARSRRGAGFDRPSRTLERRGIRPETLDAILVRQEWPALRPLLPSRIVDPEATLAALCDFAGRIIKWNRSVSNLISKNDEARIVSRHLGESLAPARRMEQNDSSSWLDFGSGGGLPALPLAICGIGSTWTLVESRRMKTLFLTKTVNEMGLSGVTIRCARLETLEGPAPGDLFDGFTSRATQNLGPTLELAANFVRPGGMAYLWKGERRDDEMLREPKWKDQWSLVEAIPVEQSPTVVLVFSRY